MSIDLPAYSLLFPDVCKKKFGRTYDFGAIEKKFSHLREGKRWLVARDVIHVFEPGATPFAHYWARPNEKDLDHVLSRLRIRLFPVPDNPHELIQHLLTAFHNIGLVSIVLRFTHPDRFAIFSTPVINTLQVQRANTIDLYIAYCDELREWQKHFKLPSVAQTGTAIWTCDQIAKQIDDGLKTPRVLGTFDSDLWIQRRRAAQVIRPFLKHHGRLELAKILVEEDAKLAGKIAAEEYERLLRSVGQKYLRKSMQLKAGEIQGLLDRLLQDEKISLEECVDLRKVWGIRNKSVHPMEDPSPTEIEWMIEQLEKLRDRWSHHGP